MQITKDYKNDKFPLTFIKSTDINDVHYDLYSIDGVFLLFDSVTNHNSIEWFMDTVGLTDMVPAIREVQTCEGCSAYPELFVNEDGKFYCMCPNNAYYKSENDVLKNVKLFDTPIDAVRAWNESKIATWPADYVKKQKPTTKLQWPDSYSNVIISEHFDFNTKQLATCFKIQKYNNRFCLSFCVADPEENNLLCESIINYFDSLTEAKDYANKLAWIAQKESI